MIRDKLTFGPTLKALTQLFALLFVALRESDAETVGWTLPTRGGHLQVQVQGPSSIRLITPNWFQRGIQLPLKGRDQHAPVKFSCSLQRKVLLPVAPREAQRLQRQGLITCDYTETLIDAFPRPESSFAYATPRVIIGAPINILQRATTAPLR